MPESKTQQVIEGCTEAEPWFPFSFPDEAHPGERTGATVELLRHATGRMGLTLRIQKLPWTRCMHLVKDGRILFAIDASPNEKREREFVFGEPLYALEQTMYSTQDASPALESGTLALSGLRICGIMGYNYEGLPFGHEQLDTSARNVRVMLKMLRAGRCDVALGYGFPYAEAARRGRLDLTGLAASPIPGAARRRFCVMATRSETGRKLVASLDWELAEMREDGSYFSILKDFGAESQAILGPVARHGADAGVP